MMKQPQQHKEVLALLRQLRIDPQSLSSEEIAQLDAALERHAARRAGARRRPLLVRIAVALAGLAAWRAASRATRPHQNGI